MDAAAAARSAAEAVAEALTPRFRRAPDAAHSGKERSLKAWWQAAVPSAPARSMWESTPSSGAPGHDSLAQHLALPVCVFAGGAPVARHLAAACRAFHQAVGESFGDIVRRFPPRLYVVGGLDAGYRPVRTAARYDPQTGSWEELPPLNGPRAGPCAASAAGRLYALGGEAAGRALADVQRFDPWTNSWETLAPMLAGRIRAAAAYCAGHLYVMGGLDGSRPLSSVERYNSKTNEWEAMPPMCRPRYACAVAVQDGQILAFGGELTDAGNAASMERYDPEARAWELLPPVRAPCCGSAVALDSTGRIAFNLGGLGLNGQALAAAEGLELEPMLSAAAAGLASPEAPAWEPLPAMPTPRHLASAAAFRDGAVVVGGKGADFEAARDVDFYNPDLGRWEVMPPLPSPRLRAALASGHL